MKCTSLLRAIFMAGLTLGGTIRSEACLWDTDTLAEEASRFPSTLEVLTGKFLRHSQEFYQWRMDDRRKIIEGGSAKAGDYDDLAVALHKLGKQEEAIQVILEKGKKFPGLYETHANHATFLIYAGRIQESLPLIDKALEINPNAHFGREIYQKYLVEYLLYRGWDKAQMIPLRPISNEPFQKLAMGRLDDLGFSAFVASRLWGETQIDLSVGLTRDQTQKAVKAVLGMMRFADFKSPILLEILGDLLSSNSIADWDAKLLAGRAYLLAGRYSGKEEYRQHARWAIIMQESATKTDGLDIEELEPILDQEIQEAETWLGKIRDDEIAWIKQGKNADIEFSKKYYREPTVLKGMDVFEIARRVGSWATFLLILSSPFLIGTLLVLFIRKLIAHFRKST